MGLNVDCVKSENVNSKNVVLNHDEILKFLTKTILLLLHSVLFYEKD